MLLAAGVAALGMASCSTPEEPVVQKPTTFELNTPPFAAQVYQLKPGGEIEFTCSQPDYGIGTVVNYSAEMSLTEDFANPVALTNKNGASSTIAVETGKIGEIICDLLGIVDEDTWRPYANNNIRPLYFRAVASLPGQSDAYTIKSNIIELPRVEFYYALKTPAFIYLVGSPEGWKGPEEGNLEHYKEWRLYEPENGIGSNIYSAVFVMPAAPMFRFYTALNGWDGDSYGSQTEDNPIDFELTDGSLETTIVKGKGSYNFPSFEGGEMTITVDLNNMTVKFEAGAAAPPVIKSYVYTVGNMAGWKEPNEDNAAAYEPWRLECSDGSGIYTATFDLTDLEADDLYCRFYQALSGWGAAQWASTTDADFPVTSGVTYDTKVGEGCFQMVGAKGKKVSIALDTNENKVTFTEVAE